MASPTRTLRRLAAVLGALALAASGQASYWTSTAFYADTACSGDPYLICFDPAADQLSCESNIQPCTTGLAETTVQGCVETTEEAPVPVPANVASVYVAVREYNAATCTGGFSNICYYAAGVCQYNQVYDYVDTDNEVTIYTCSDASCSSCGAPDVHPAGECVSTTEYGAFAPLTPASPAVYATPSEPFAPPRALASPVSDARDCFAAAGETIYGGWKVTWNSEDVRRGGHPLRAGGGAVHSRWR